jgi:hypothetical protein
MKTKPSTLTFLMFVIVVVPLAIALRRQTNATIQAKLSSPA